MFRSTFVLALLLLLAATIGCSGSEGAPTIPGELPDGSPLPGLTDDQPGSEVPEAPVLPGERISNAGPTHYCWGIWQFTVDPIAKSIDIVPLREADFHLNVLPFLEPPPLVNVSLDSLEINGNIIEADIGLTHPFIGLDEFSGFDVCGIFITNGSVDGFTDSDLMMAGPGDTRLLNPDGFARWWNPDEFSGNPDGLLGTPDYIAHYNSTINPYKYYADDLDPADDISDLPLSSRGLFTAGEKNIRNFIIKLGDAGLVFNYAIDACWEFPTGSGPWNAPADFPAEANRAEAWRIEVTELENKLFNDGSESGGELHMTIDAYDWFNVDLNSLLVESPGNFTAVTVPAGSDGGDGYSTYAVDIETATPQASGDMDILISVISEEENFDGFISGVNTTAYFIHTTTVLDEKPSYIEVLTPNGGEDWIIGSTQEITWDSEYVDGTVFIEYSKDHFVSDTHTISSDETNDGTYQWLTPDDPSTTVKVRVSSTDVPSVSDTSEEDFTLKYGIGVTSPNGGEVWDIATSHDITWSAPDITGTVFIEYSKNNFVSDVHTIATGEPNDGTFSWLIPNDPSTTVRVRVSSTSTPIINDVSNADFRIMPWITIVSPNGGEEWLVGSNHNIYWNHTGVSGTVDIEYSKNNFVSDIHTITLNETNGSIFTWMNIPADPSGTVKVRVKQSSDATVYDTSDANFTIKAWITLSAPNGGESWYVGSSHGITWTSGGVSGTVDIHYSKDNFSSDINTIAMNETNDGSFTWSSIPNDPSTTVKVRVRSSSDITVNDASDADFSIISPWITVTSPNGGEGWYVGSSYDITWTSAGVSGTVDIHYSKDNFSSDINTIALNEINDGTYNWPSIPNDPSDTVRIRVRSSLDTAVNDVSDANFYILEYHGGWARTWGGDSWNEGYGVAVDGSGNAYVTGRFMNTVDFDPGPGVDEHTSNGFGDIFLCKFDADGNLLWARTWGGNDRFDEGYSVAIDGSGNAYVTGNFNVTVDFDPGSGVDEHTSNGGLDIFLCKFDADGNFLWARTWGGSAYYESGYGVAVDGSGNAYITGIYYWTIDFDPGPGVDVHTTNGVGDTFLSKFDTDGNFLWARTWGGIDFEVGHGVAVDGSGNAYVTGVFKETVDFDPGPGVDEHTSQGIYDIFLSKFNPDGNLLWARTWGGSDSEKGSGVAIDGSGNAYITGYFYDTADFDPGPGVDEHTSNGNGDVFLSKFDSSGNFLWARTWGGMQYEEGSAVAIDGSGNAYITGNLYGTADFDPGPGVDEHISHGLFDAFLSKIPPGGDW